jgi:hypothetical protein
MRPESNILVHDLLYLAHGQMTKPKRQIHTGHPQTVVPFLPVATSPEWARKLSTSSHCCPICQQHVSVHCHFSVTAMSAFGSIAKFTIYSSYITQAKHSNSLLDRLSSTLTFKTRG